MAAVFLHIGAMKTGTTYLQHVLIANRERLAEAGYLFPGRTWARQVRAAQDVLGVARDDPVVRAESAGVWRELSDEMLAHTGRASVMSMEFLSFAGPAVAKRVVTSLQPADVHVVLTVRDTLATIPAHWQTNIHNGSRVSWPDFMLGVRKATQWQGRLGRFAPDPATRAFRRVHDIPRMLRTWAPLVPPDRLHVVTVAPPGAPHSLLWERFASAVGIDPGTCVEPPRQSNPSLGYPSAELLRRVNLELGRLRRTDYNPTLNAFLATQVLTGRDEPRARTDLATRTFAVGWNARVREAIVASGAHLIGDLDDLPTELPPSASDENAEPTEPAEQEVLAAGAAALEALQQLVQRRVLRLRRRGLEAPLPAPQSSGSVQPDRWNGDPDPVAAAAKEVAGVARTAIDLHRRLRGRPSPAQQTADDTADEVG